MAKFSMKRDGKEVGPASVYAEPHTMAGKAFTVKDAQKAQSPNRLPELKIAVGQISKSQNDEVKSDGIKIRGTGAATKGVMARGPMA